MPGDPADRGALEAAGPGGHLAGVQEGQEDGPEAGVAAVAGHADDGGA